MKKGCTYILLFILLLNNTSYNEIFKVPALISHFIEHHRLDHNVGLIEFLSMHYWGKDINDNDQDKDMKLPFKKVDAHACFQIAVPTTKTTVEKQQFFTVNIPQQKSQDLDLSNPALASLFRPPRI